MADHHDRPAMVALHRFDRWMYRGGRPNGLARFLNNGWGLLAARGLAPRRLEQLEVKGRRSGQIRSLPVVVADFRGERYLVSMLGESAGWVENLRAAGGEAVLRHGQPEHVRLEDVPTAERPPIIKRYLECAPGARAHIPVHRRAPLEDFARIADSVPVFRIRPSQQL